MQLQELSPWNIAICKSINSTPYPTLYHAIDLNWSIGKSANIAAAPVMVLKLEG